MNNEIEGIVLSSIDYKETSKIVYLYTPIGCISVKALQAKKIKNGELAFITTGNIVSFVMTDKELPTLVEYHLIEGVFSLTLDIKKLTSLSIILEVLRHIPNDSIHDRIFRLAKNYISYLKDYNEKKILSIFLIKMLYAFGVNPELKKCVRCGSNNLIDFVPRLGGALCNNCSTHNNKLLPYWIEYYYQKKNIDEYNDCDFDLLLNEITNYYSYHLSIYLKLSMLK